MMLMTIVCNDAIITPQVSLQLEQYDDLQIGQPQQIVRYPASDVQRLHTLGTGSFYKVSLVILKSEKKDFAMKHIDRKKISSAKEFLVAATDLVMEAHVLSQLDHPYIIKLRGVPVTPFTQSLKEDETCFFLLLDVMDETLQDRLRKWRNDPSCFEKRNIFSKLKRKPKKLNFEKMLGRMETVTFGIAEAMNYIHERGILHRDLKAANVGFNKVTGDVCIFDFGFARELANCPSDEICGTPRYMAPEVLRGEGYSFKSDVYSFGFLLHEVASLQEPTPKHISMKLQSDVWNACSALTRPSLDGIPCPNVAQMIQDCWTDNPESRPTFLELCLSLRAFLTPMTLESSKKVHVESESTIDTLRS